MVEKIQFPKSIETFFLYAIPWGGWGHCFVKTKLKLSVAGIITDEGEGGFAGVPARQRRADTSVRPQFPDADVYNGRVTLLLLQGRPISFSVLR